MFVEKYTKRIDYFAYPRVGSHFLFHIFSGLYELILFESEDFKTEEYLARKNEINEFSLYALSLSDLNKSTRQPIFVNPKANGIHGTPIDSGFPIISLIRHPLATAYSYYRLERDRFNRSFSNEKAWILDKLNEFDKFYTQVFEVKNKIKNDMLILNFEDLVSDDKYINNIVDFFNVEPKLDPNFVYNCTKFENFTSNSDRTFYRNGDNEKWLQDDNFKLMIKDFDFKKFRKFGYNHFL